MTLQKDFSILNVFTQPSSEKKKNRSDKKIYPPKSHYPVHKHTHLHRNLLEGEERENRPVPETEKQSAAAIHHHPLVDQLDSQVDTQRRCGWLSLSHLSPVMGAYVVQTSAAVLSGRFPSVHFICTLSEFSYSLVYCSYLLSHQRMRSINMQNNWLLTRIISFICLIFIWVKYCRLLEFVVKRHIYFNLFWTSFCVLLEKTTRDFIGLKKIKINKVK